MSRTVPDTADLFQPLEDIIRHCFLPTLTGQNMFSDSIRDLTALPARLGGLGIANLVKQAESQHRFSCRVTAPLVKHIIEQSRELPAEVQVEQFQAKRAAHHENHQIKTNEAKNLLTTLPNSLQKAVEIAQETGASMWLTALPISEHGLLSTKGHFVMRSAYGMAGDHPFYHHSVFVTSVSHWSMH